MTSPLTNIQSSIALENFVGKLPPRQKTPAKFNLILTSEGIVLNTYSIF
jgi:hypothetical protein